MGRRKIQGVEGKRWRKVQLNFTKDDDRALETWRSYLDAGNDAEAIRRAVRICALLKKTSTKSTN